MQSRLVLASQSPRRREILTAAGLAFDVRIPHVEERRAGDESPAAYVRRLAREKADAVELRNGEVILGADTTVVVDGIVLEKPAGREDAVRMLKLLSGREHEVITAICLRSRAGTIVDMSRTRVRFAAMTPEEIAAYADSGEPYDKAGGYAIQGLASKYIDQIEGCYFNVVGLPVSLVYRHLKEIDCP